MCEIDETDLFVTAEDDKAAAAGLAALRCAQSPERDRATAVLGEPALELALGGVVGETAEVEDLGALTKESANVAAGVERARKDVGVAGRVRLRWARLLAERTKAAGQGERLLKSAARRRRRESLKVEGKATGDFARGADLLNLETGANGGQAGGAEGESLGVVGLESLVFAAKTEQDGMLHVGGEDDALVAGLTRHLHTQVPGSQGDKGELGSSARAGVLVHKVLAGVSIEGGNGITEAASLFDVLPGQGGKGGAQRGDGSVCRADQHGLVVQLRRVSAGIRRFKSGPRRYGQDNRRIFPTEHFYIHTSGREGSFASTTTQPISITSALSLVT